MNDTPTLRRLESIDSAAERHGIATKTIRRRIADGTIPAYRLGPRLLRVDPAEVDAALLSPVPTVHHAEAS
jgi:excisionase family DNA binding protein